jgi:uncharacterized protein YbjT (DUF2867 family)
MTTTTRTALILGANGGIGSEAARALARHGWRIRALSRSGRSTNSDPSWDWVKGDSMDQASIVAAAQGAECIEFGSEGHCFSSDESSV